VIQALTLILALQLAGEVIVRAAGLVIPGPVLGMSMFLILMVLVPKIVDRVRAPANGLLQHLSLLFVPAGVGVVGHINALGADIIPLVIAIAASTAAAIAVGALAFTLTAKLTGNSDD
jgi:putative effector of murein hydrolase LrgA (UPF0299 family)